MSKVVLQSGDIQVDADPAVLASLVHRLVNDRDFRSAFERNPAVFLEECGIKVPKGTRITPESIAKALSEGQNTPEAIAALVAPGVAPAIRVGTRPGTSPGVRVGVRVATGTAAFAEPDRRWKTEALVDLVDDAAAAKKEKK